MGVPPFRYLIQNGRSRFCYGLAIPCVLSRRRRGYVKYHPRWHVHLSTGRGRHSFRQSGISHCGALDKPALNVANLLVGNDANAAALEITLGQLVVEFEADGWFALTGAGCEAHLDRTPVWSGWRLPVKAGQRLTLKRPLHGMRSYLAVAGGIDVPEVMGSRSTDLKVGIGGFEGRLLRDGDRLAIGISTRQFNGPQGVKQLMWGNLIRALPALNIRSLMRYRRPLSGVRRGNLAHKVTVWGIVFRGSR